MRESCEAQGWQLGSDLVSVCVCLCLCVCKQSLDVLIGQPCPCAKPLMARLSSWSDQSSYTILTCYCMTSQQVGPVPRQLEQITTETGQGKELLEEYEVVVTKVIFLYSKGKAKNTTKQIQRNLKQWQNYYRSGAGTWYILSHSHARVADRNMISKTITVE